MAHKFGEIHHDWSFDTIKSLYDWPFMDLLFKAQAIHRENFDQHQVQISTLLSLKTGACPEDCAYCPQSGHYPTGVEKEQIISLEKVKACVKKAKDNGATRFCIGAGWRGPHDKHLPILGEIIKIVKAQGMECCMSLGLLSASQAKALKAEGLDYYNHNIDTSPEYYKKIITTRTFDDRLNTLEHVRDAKIRVCCGGILGLGETREDRFKWLLSLVNMPEHPPSVPINKLIPIPGTPLGDTAPLDNFEFIRFVAMARILMPASRVRLSAGRNEFNDEMHALCFFAGANSIHFGEKLFVTPLPDTKRDLKLLSRMDLKPIEIHA